MYTKIKLASETEWRDGDAVVTSAGGGAKTRVKSATIVHDELRLELGNDSQGMEVRVRLNMTDIQALLGGINAVLRNQLSLAHREHTIYRQAVVEKDIGLDRSAHERADNALAWGHEQCMSREFVMVKPSPTTGETSE